MAQVHAVVARASSSVQIERFSLFITIKNTIKLSVNISGVGTVCISGLPVGEEHSSSEVNMRLPLSESFESLEQ